MVLFQIYLRPCRSDISEHEGNIIRNLDISKQRLLNTLSDDYEYGQKYINDLYENTPEWKLKPYLDPKPEDVSDDSTQCKDPSVLDSVWEQRQRCESTKGCRYERNTIEWNTCEPWTCDKISEIGWNNESTDNKNIQNDRKNKCENNPYGLNCGIAYPRHAASFPHMYDEISMVCMEK